MKLIGKVSQYEKILAYMKDPDPEAEKSLTEHEKTTLNRWMEAFTLIRNYNSTADATAILMKRFPGISRATAYRDCSNAISLFGDISRSTKEGIRHLATEIARDAIEIARAANDFDAMIRGANAIAKINGVNLNDPDLPDFAKLQPHTFELALPDNALQVLKQMVSGGSVDLTNFAHAMNSIAEDAKIIDEQDGQ